MPQKDRGPRVFFPPPLMFICWMLLGYVASYTWPWLSFESQVASLIGALSALSGLAFIWYCHELFKKAQTAIEPWRKTSAIIDIGVYGKSRNPIYLGFAVITIGVGLIFNHWGIVFSVLPSLVSVYLFAVKKEEAYLEKVFGQSYADYKTRVPRWF